jgi:hypothetical protein
MPRLTELDRQWQQLMSLCEKEKEFKSTRRHPKLLRFVTEQIDQLSAEMGFTPRQVERREFRAVKDRGHIVRLLTEET